MPRLLSPLAPLPQPAARRPLRIGQLGEDFLRLAEQARGLHQRRLSREARLERVGQLGLDQLADFGTHENRVDPSLAMATIPLLLVLAAAQDPAARARELATRLPPAYRAYLEVRREAGAIGDPALRAAVEAQVLAPWLPPQAWAYGHLAEARKLLGDPKLELPPPRKGDFLAAPGGACEDGHHGYPGGLSVHTLATLRQARALAESYRHVYGVEVHTDQITTAVIWQGTLMAATLPFRANGSCGPEAEIAGAPAHHVLGLGAGILRHLPDDLLYVIAAAPSPDPN